jgi:hypothetical protein
MIRFASMGGTAQRMMATVLLLLSSSVAAGCAQDTQEKGEALFDDLDPPSFNRLRGVYTTTVDLSPAETIEIRLRFTDDVIIGASKCTKSGITVIATGEAELSTGAIDAATGTVTLDDLLMSRPYAPGRADLCEAGLRAATYNFRVEEDKLTLWVEGEMKRTYRKIGD